MRARTFVIFLALLAGCPSSAIRGSTSIWQQTRYGLNTRQSCLAEPEVLRLAELAATALLHEAVTGKWVSDYGTAWRLLGSPAVCLVQRPEPCWMDGPVKAGCASVAAEGWAWVSVEWPAGTVRDWRSDLLHEVSHVVAYRLGIPQRADHTGPWMDAERRALAVYLKGIGR